MATINYFEKIQNPLDKEDFLKDIVKIYSESESNFNKKISQNIEKKYKKGNHNTKSSDKFYSYIFNTWKNTISTLTPEEIRKNNRYSEDVIILKEYLSDVKNINTEQEIDKIINSQSDTKLADIIHKYKWDNIEKDEEFIHISSNYLTNKKGLNNIEHGLYINCESMTLYEILNEFINECNKYDLPYYFKFNPLCIKDESIVFYTNSEYLDRHLHVLKTIIETVETAHVYMREPNILVGRIEEKIGYGSETLLKSYLKIRINIIEKAIKKVIYTDIKKHITSTTTYKGKKIQFSQFLSILTTEYFCKKLENKFIEKSKVVNEPELELGYNLSQIKHKALKGNVCELINKSIINNLFLLFEGKKSKIKNIEMSVENNKKVIFTAEDLENATTKIASKIFEDNQTLYNDLQLEILSLCKEYGISLNFAVDMNCEKALQVVEKHELKEVVSEEQQLATETEKLIEKINPEYLTKSVVLEDGKTMIAINYLKNIIYPIIPTSGIFILKDNTEIDYVTFIEKFILDECQNTYNGNLSKYLFDKIKYNKGEIELNYEGENTKINSADIVDFLTNDDLIKRVIINGKDITAEEYIISYFADFIPSNGMFILKDNAEVNVIDYISSTLLSNLLEKYSGNVMQILLETTKNNKNIIDLT